MIDDFKYFYAKPEIPECFQEDMQFTPSVELRGDIKWYEYYSKVLIELVRRIEIQD